MARKHKEKRTKHLRVPVTAQEDSIIKLHARPSGLSCAEFMRRLSLGYQIKSALDHAKIKELSHINADLGRVAGLLKMLLTNEERFSDAGLTDAKVQALVDEIASLKELAESTEKLAAKDAELQAQKAAALDRIESHIKESVPIQADETPYLASKGVIWN